MFIFSLLKKIIPILSVLVLGLMLFNNTIETKRTANLFNSNTSLLANNNYLNDQGTVLNDYFGDNLITVNIGDDTFPNYIVTSDCLGIYSYNLFLENSKRQQIEKLYKNNIELK